MDILNFLKELKYSYHLNEKIYTEGSCFRLYKIISAIFNNAEPFYSSIDGHWVTRVGDKYYDINGEISKQYVEDKRYEKEISEIILSSAYVPRYEGQSCSYGKYIKTI